MSKKVLIEVATPAWSMKRRFEKRDAYPMETVEATLRMALHERGIDVEIGEDLGTTLAWLDAEMGQTDDDETVALLRALYVLFLRPERQESDDRWAAFSKCPMPT